jgi:hypothetical protein
MRPADSGSLCAPIKVKRVYALQLPCGAGAVCSGQMQVQASVSHSLALPTNIVHLFHTFYRFACRSANCYTAWLNDHERRRGRSGIVGPFAAESGDQGQDG